MHYNTCCSYKIKNEVLIPRFVPEWHCPFIHTAPTLPPAVQVIQAHNITINISVTSQEFNNLRPNSYQINYLPLGTRRPLSKTVMVTADHSNAETARDSPGYLVSNLTPSTEYVVQVAAVNVLGSSKLSPPISVHTKEGGECVFMKLHKE